MRIQLGCTEDRPTKQLTADIYDIRSFMRLQSYCLLVFNFISQMRAVVPVSRQPYGLFRIVQSSIASLSDVEGKSAAEEFTRYVYFCFDVYGTSLVHRHGFKLVNRMKRRLEAHPTLIWHDFLH
ncbi:hypothetical protein EG68_04056 [Paragonimus skrjabini miyazakii]|uniref:Uncharacterized protein n=1 Tax=Paragonimus skrjabini miyazakii TaxID=59628 RepID=A0A8S9YYA8_9TREM|nr:hypothetical protein EG68_04056 [Paragonimus skrjabini miyazakii]